MNSSLHYLFHNGKNSKLAFYLRSALGDMIPDGLFRSRLEREMEICRQMFDEEYIADRVNYYCKLSETTDLGPAPVTFGDLHRKNTSSAYYYDCHEITRWFDPDTRWNYKFGDLREIPPFPTIVKSRGLVEDNANSVLLKLNKNRHFIYLNDKIDFADKRDMAIFRGQVAIRENRKKFVSMFADNPRVDAANTLGRGGLSHDKGDGQPVSPRLSLYDHLKYRFIMTLEGNDVASNLKWVMSSNSLAVMPKPTCETWFMEGRLKPGVHYVEIKPDFSDLLEKMDYYSNHLEESRFIIYNANQYVGQFRDRRRERYIGLRVMQRYLELCK